MFCTANNMNVLQIRHFLDSFALNLLIIALSSTKTNAG